jgi:indolepyruvate ferredoxin oxidoreductase beta subunit
MSAVETRRAEESYDLVIAGVGGQGNVLASRIVAQAALRAGLPLRTSETFGVAQREGAVMSQVRLGQEGVGPLIPQQGARAMVALEPAEAVRNLGRVRCGGTILVDAQPVYPVASFLGKPYHPGEMEEHLTRLAADGQYVVKFIPAARIAAELGEPRVANAVLLGAMSALDLPFPGEYLLDALLEMVPAAKRDLNRVAFQEGRRLGEVA